MVRRKKKKTRVFSATPTQKQTRDLHQYLKQIYTNPNQGGSFAGAKKLWQEVKRRGYFKNVKLKDIQKFLDTLTSYSLFRPAVRKFHKPAVYVTSVDDQISSDLVDVSKLSSQNSQIKYLLTAIEVLSRFAYVRPLKSKEGSVVADAMRSILDQSGKHFKSNCTDLGSEFKAASWKGLMKEYNIRHFFAGGSGSCTILERFHRNLRTKMARYMYENQTDVYQDKLQSFVDSYNKTLHSSIGFRPVDVNEKNEHQVYQTLYLDKKMPASKPYKFKTNDTVRISYRRNIFDREGTQRWSEQLYTIVSRRRLRNINLYKLRDCGGENITGSFYEQEMSNAGIGENTKYRIESLLEEKTNDAGIRMVKVQWAGHPKECATWEPKASITGRKKKTA